MRIRRLIALLAAVATGATGFAAAAFNDGSTFEVGKAEAARLLERAQALVKDIGEDGYSYAYIQFYWKRAQENLDRIVKVYPGTPAALAIQNGELKVGTYDLVYFKERVLPQLEKKVQAAYDDVTCANFLQDLDEKRFDATRTAAIELILEVLARRGRWGEALQFPVLEEQEPMKYDILFKVAARQQTKDMVEQLLADATPTQKARYWPILAEAYALLGKPRKDIAALLDEHPEPGVKIAALRGMVTREIQIQRAAALRVSVEQKQGFNMPHYSLLDLDVRDDVESVARTFFPGGNTDAIALLATYRAALGSRPSATSPVEALSAYLEYLGAFDRTDEIATYVQSIPDARVRRTLALKSLEVLSAAGHAAEADQVRAGLVRTDPSVADAALLAQFLGRLANPSPPFEVRSTTFSSLAIKDPCLLSQAIMESTLARNYSIRGAAPWDSVIQRFLPGFDNLPDPELK